MPTTNELHDIQVDGQRYIIKRHPCITGTRNFSTGRIMKDCERCRRWRLAYNQGYTGHKTHIIMMCFCRACAHEEFVLEEWLKSESFSTAHRDYLRRQSENKARSYEGAFQRDWAEPLHETVKLALEDLDSEDIREAKIKLSTILHKIEQHKVTHHAVEGWEG